MKKFLEVLMDDDGNLHLSTDFEFADSVENPPTDMKELEKENDRLSRLTMEGVINAIWKERKIHVSKAIRYLSMAEIISDAQPYDNAEHLWGAMMFDYIPCYEKYASKLKTPYGFDPSKVIRPIKFGSFPGGVMPITGFGRKMS